MLSSLESEAVVRRGLIDLHAENPGRSNFTEGEVAVSAIAHHAQYMKWYGRVGRLRGWIGRPLPDKPVKAPTAFKMPTVSEGLLRIKEKGELNCQVTGDVRTFTGRDGEVIHNRSNATRLVGLTEEAQIKAGLIVVPEAVSQNGNGAVPSEQLAMIDLNQVAISDSDVTTTA